MSTRTAVLLAVVGYIAGAVGLMLCSQYAVADISLPLILLTVGGWMMLFSSWLMMGPKIDSRYISSGRCATTIGKIGMYGFGIIGGLAFVVATLSLMAVMDDVKLVWLTLVFYGLTAACFYGLERLHRKYAPVGKGKKPIKDRVDLLYEWQLAMTYRDGKKVQKAHDVFDEVYRYHGFEAIEALWEGGYTTPERLVRYNEECYGIVSNMIENLGQEE